MFFRFTSLVVLLALTGDAVAFPVHAGRPSAPIVATLWGWSPWFQGAGILAAIAWVGVIRMGTEEICAVDNCPGCFGDWWKYLLMLAAVLIGGLVASGFRDIGAGGILTFVVLPAVTLFVAYLPRFYDCARVVFMPHPDPQEILDHLESSHGDPSLPPPVHESEARRDRTEALTRQLVADAELAKALADHARSRAHLDAVRANLPWWQRYR